MRTLLACIITALAVPPTGAALGCAAKQAGVEFCRSYERNYIGQCRQLCESERDDAPSAATSDACKKQCAGELADDSTFGDSCPADAKRLAAEAR